MNKNLRRQKYTRKQKFIKPRCGKDEYYNRTTKKCKKQTKKPVKKQTKKRKKQVKKPVPKSYSNNKNSINLKSIKSVEKNTRIFLILGHSSLCTTKELIDIRYKKESRDFRLNLGLDKEIAKIDDLKVINLQSIGLNYKDFISNFIEFLKTNEKFYSAFLQVDSIEKAEILNQFFKQLFLKKIPLNQIKLIENVYDENFVNLKVYPKPSNKFYPQNPINSTFSFCPNEPDEKGIFGIFELTIPKYIDNNIGYLQGDYDINDILLNKYINYLFKEEKKDLKKITLKTIKSFLGIPSRTTKSRINVGPIDYELTKINEETKNNFYKFINLNEKLFNLIEQKYKKTNNLNKASKFKLDELIKFIISENNIQKDEKIIILDSGCKGIRGLPYDVSKSAVIPSQGKWESSIKFDPWTTGPLGYNSVSTIANLPHKYRKIFQNVDYNI